MKVSDAFPSKYLSAEDLGDIGTEVTVTIAQVMMEDMQTQGTVERKLMVSFAGASKKLVLNKTNAKAIAYLWGDDTDDWIGKRITLTVQSVQFKSDIVNAIRVKLVKPDDATPAAVAPAPAAAPVPAAPAPQQHQAITEDEIPF